MSVRTTAASMASFSMSCDDMSACVALGGVLVRLVVDPGPPSMKEREWS